MWSMEAPSQKFRMFLWVFRIQTKVSFCRSSSVPQTCWFSSAQPPSSLCALAFQPVLCSCAKVSTTSMYLFMNIDIFSSAFIIRYHLFAIYQLAIQPVSVNQSIGRQKFNLKMKSVKRSKKRESIFIAKNVWPDTSHVMRKPVFCI